MKEILRLKVMQQPTCFFLFNFYRPFLNVRENFLVFMINEMVSNFLEKTMSQAYLLKNLVFSHDIRSIQNKQVNIVRNLKNIVPNINELITQ